VLQCVAALLVMRIFGFGCSVLQCVAVCCSVLQCVAALLVMRIFGCVEFVCDVHIC